MINYDGLKFHHKTHDPEQVYRLERTPVGYSCFWIERDQEHVVHYPCAQVLNNLRDGYWIPVENVVPYTKTAVDLLNEAAACIGDRAASRDTDKERSMATTVNAFNEMYGTKLTEQQGWMFMVFLKASRAKGGEYREDDFIDGAAYFALAGECS